jgi:hypothetical protein
VPHGVPHCVTHGTNPADSGSGQFQNPLLDAKQAGELLNVPATWVEAEARKGSLPSVHLGAYRRYEVEQLQAWYERHREGPAGVVPARKRRKAP